MVRRLATILAADVVGYSRLMENDEAGTLASLKAHRAEFIDPLISEYGGRIVKLVGDGTLAEVASVVEAQCAYTAGTCSVASTDQGTNFRQRLQSADLRSEVISSVST